MNPDPYLTHKTYFNVVTDLNKTMKLLEKNDKYLFIQERQRFLYSFQSSHQRSMNDFIKIKIF